MPARKLPQDAFDAYVALGVGRSYAAIAEKYAVSKRAVTALAKREDWQGRLLTIETKAKENGDQKAVETLEAMRARHLIVYQAIQRKAIDALKVGSIPPGMDAVRALDLALAGERLIRGEPTERTAVEIETKIRKEHELLLIPKGAKDDWSDLERPADQQAGAV